MDEYLKYLRKVFELFKKYNVAISPNKAFIKYFNVKLFKRRINFIGLFIIKEILKIIAKIKYPKTFNILKYYFRLTGYLRKYIYNYV